MSNSPTNIIINKLKNDVPIKQSHFTISFLDSNTYPELTNYNILSFKVYNAYTDSTEAQSDAKNIRENITNHDIFVGKIGCIHNWNDVQTVDDVIYGVEKLDAMEKKKKENDNTKKIVTEQYKTELNNFRSQFDINANNKKKVIDRQNILRSILHDRGTMTNSEIENYNKIAESYNLATESSKPTSELDEEAKKYSDTDYLDVFENPTYNFGIISIYTPKILKGLTQPVFKIRGLYQERDPNNPTLTQKKLDIINDKDGELKRFNFIFQVGYWTPHCFETKDDAILSETRLNYLMKFHLDQIKKDQERINNEIEQAKNNSKKASKKLRKKDKKNTTTIDDTPKTSTPVEDEIFKDIGTEEDKQIIDEIAEYLKEPELLDKFKAKEVTEQTYDITKKN